MRGGGAPRRKVSIPVRLSDPQEQLTPGSVSARQAPDGVPCLGLGQLGRPTQWVEGKSTEDGRGAGVPSEKATGGEDKASGGDQGPSRKEKTEHRRKIKRKRAMWCLVCGRS